MNIFMILFRDIARYFYGKLLYLFQRYSSIYKKNTYINSSSVSKDSQIGKYTYIGYNTAITRTTIGNYCSIASNVSIGMGEHDLDQISTNSIFYENQYEDLTKKDCSIGNDVWIGVDAIIRRWISIGNWAVIGANSFVNSDVPPYAIVAGSPAKVIRYRFTDAQITQIEDSQWWVHDKTEAKRIMEELTKGFHA